MREQSSRRLVAGGIIVAALAALGAAILVFGRVGRVPGDTVRLYATMGSVRGVMRGSDVWLSGKRVGRVADVRVLPVTADSSRRFLLSLEVMESALPLMRRDSNVDLRAGGRLTSMPVVHVSAGTLGAPPLRPRDTVYGRPQRDPEAIASQMAVASRQFPELIANLKALRGVMDSGGGSVGAFMSGEPAGEIAALRRGTGRLGARVRGRQGTVGLALANRTKVAADARRALARVDSIRTLLATGDGTLGRFRRDSTLARSVAAVRDEVAALRRQLASSGASVDGTVGRFRSDSALFAELGRTGAEMTALMADIKKHPLRYLSF